MPNRPTGGAAHGVTAEARNLVNGDERRHRHESRDGGRKVV